MLIFELIFVDIVESLNVGENVVEIAKFLLHFGGGKLLVEKVKEKVLEDA